MNDEFVSRRRSNGEAVNVKDVFNMIFRRRRLLRICAVGTVIATILGAWLLPRYKGEAKFLLMRGRVDPVISTSPEQNAFALAAEPVITDEELKSEVELLTSYDLEREVVRAVHPEKVKHGFPIMAKLTGWWMTPEEKEASAIRKLDKDLNVEVTKGTNIILVEYKNFDPEVAKAVLEKIKDAYLARHMRVHRPEGEFGFFEQQTNLYRKNMEDAEAKLSSFPTEYGAVSPATDRDITLQRLNDFKASLHQAQAEIAGLQHRIRELKDQQQATPDRITTQLKKSDNAQLMEQLKATLLNLELKRIDLLTKFQADYRPVQEVEKEIANTKAAIQAQQAAPIEEATTDVDPTHQWIIGDLAKAEADLAGLQAKEAAYKQTVQMYEARARDLDRKAIVQKDLVREVNAQENKYLMYLNKREEARITDALDAHRILNVAIAEEPIVPALPSHSPMLFAMVIFTFLTMMTAGLIWTLEYFDTTLHSQSEVENFLQIPVLATIPLTANGNGAHSNGNANGNGRGWRYLRRRPAESDSTTATLKQ